MRLQRWLLVRAGDVVLRYAGRVAGVLRLIARVMRPCGAAIAGEWRAAARSTPRIARVRAHVGCDQVFARLALLTKRVPAVQVPVSVPLELTIAGRGLGRRERWNQHHRGSADHENLRFHRQELLLMLLTEAGPHARGLTLLRLGTRRHSVCAAGSAKGSSLRCNGPRRRC